MSVARAARLEPLHQLEVPVTKRALVIGGGVAGMHTAFALAEQDIALSPQTPEQTVNLEIRVPKPGHYTGDLPVVDGDKIIAEKMMGFVASPEKIPPPPVPDDFDAFWDRTLAELEKNFPGVLEEARFLVKARHSGPHPGMRRWAG